MLVQKFDYFLSYKTRYKNDKPIFATWHHLNKEKEEVSDEKGIKQICLAEQLGKSYLMCKTDNTPELKYCMKSLKFLAQTQMNYLITTNSKNNEQRTKNNS